MKRNAMQCNATKRATKPNQTKPSIIAHRSAVHQHSTKQSSDTDDDHQATQNTEDAMSPVPVAQPEQCLNCFIRLVLKTWTGKKDDRE
mmetsp:Transcript_8698/g.25805  ORF Transcript_8698/g.25805 Transcript_8698/m.25805 type:complete len:88 (-) Transcript_8698:337-600(-)